MKFTFKKVINTGRWKSFQPESCTIKLNKKVVGSINEIKTVGYTVEDIGKFYIRLMVIKKDIMEDKNPNCTWKNITFKLRFNTMDNAKEWLNNNLEGINKTYNLYKAEE
jgi:hypothetical protein